MFLIGFGLGALIVGLPLIWALILAKQANDRMRAKMKMTLEQVAQRD